MRQNDEVTVRGLLAAAPRGTQARLAEAAGVNVATVSRWASGSVVPTEPNCRAIEQFFGLDSGELSGYALQSRAEQAAVIAERIAGLEAQIEALVEVVAGMAERLKG